MESRETDTTVEAQEHGRRRKRRTILGVILILVGLSGHAWALLEGGAGLVLELGSLAIAIVGAGWIEPKLTPDPLELLRSLRGRDS